MSCRSCAGGLVPWFNLGNQHLSDFRDDAERPPRYHLNIDRCEACGLAQLRSSIPTHLMYHDRYGYKSGVNGTVKADLKDVVHQAFVASKRPVKAWLDIACNDGTLLSYLPREGVYRVGVDPIQKLALEAEQHADFILNDFFHPDDFDAASFDVITSISVFYDLDDPNEFVEGVAEVLAPGGVWVIQQNYLGASLRLNAIDNFCHEHITYFTLGTLEPLLARHGLMVFSCSESSVNGGSFRVFVTQNGTRLEDGTVQELREKERRGSLHTDSPYERFAERAFQRLHALRDLVGALSKHEAVAIYGASTRGATIWQAANLGPSQIVYAVERNPDKIGKQFSAINVPIIGEAEAREDHPAYMVVGPWFFLTEFLEREKQYLQRGGHFIVPLPDVTVI